MWAFARATFATRRIGERIVPRSTVMRDRSFSTKKSNEFDLLYPRGKIDKRHGGGGGSSSGSSSSRRSSPIFVRSSNSGSGNNQNDRQNEDPETVKQGNRIFWTLFAAMGAFMLYNIITANPVEDQRERAKKANEFLKQNAPKKYRLNAEERIHLQEGRVRAWKIAAPDLALAQSVGAKIVADYNIKDTTDGSQIKIKKTNGDISFQSNYPLIPVTSTDYFEVLVESKPADSVAAVGIATKPYPAFRLPGWDQMSVGYHGDDGHKFLNNNEGGEPYGPVFGERDVVGCGIECKDENNRNCAVYFTLNGLRLDNATNNLNQVDYGYFPTVGCFGACTLTVNFGQTPFRYYKRRDRAYGDDDRV